MEKMIKFVNLCASTLDYCQFMGWDTWKKLKQSINVQFILTLSGGQAMETH